jgi:organic radical activating enzyme
MKKSDDLYHFRDNTLNEVSPSFCTAKWKQVTLHLHSGQTHSCHHPVPHKIPLDEIADNPSALHNTKFKKLQRKLMLEGKRPSECDYCWRVEDCNSEALSDRVYKSAEPWARNFIDEIVSKPWDDDVNPSYLEVSFSSVCNLKCSYCSPQVSSKWMEEIKEHGPYNTSNKFNDLQWLIQTDAMPIPNREHNPYVEAFWKWWPEVSTHLHHFRITGGEPLLTKDTFKVLDDLIANPKPNLEVSINSNMCVPDAVFNKFIEKMKIIGSEGKVKALKIFTSAEAYGAQAEYIRHGLNYNQWLSNIRRVLEEVPNCTFTCMSTYNVLSIFSFDKMLKDLLDLKLEFGGAGKAIPIILDTPYLRYPNHQAMFIAEPEWRDKYVKPQLDFIYNNLEDRNVRGKENMGFFQWEGDKFKRLYDIINEEHLDEETLRKNRSDFVIFVDEHDKRRGTNFLKTFPEMKQFYQDCKLIT